MSTSGDPLAALRERFLSRCADDLETIRRAAQGQGDPSLETIVHRLAGTAGTFGFWEVSQAAGPIDDCLQDGGAPSTDSLQALAEALLAVL